MHIPKDINDNIPKHTPINIGFGDKSFTFPIPIKNNIAGITNRVLHFNLVVGIII